MARRFIGLCVIATVIAVGANAQDRRSPPSDVGPLCQTARGGSPPTPASKCLILDELQSHWPYNVEPYNHWPYAVDNVESPILFSPLPGKLVFQPAKSVCLRCISVFRQFVFAFALNIRNPDGQKLAENKFNQDLTSRASRSIESSFGTAATQAQRQLDGLIRPTQFVEHIGRSRVSCCQRPISRTRSIV
jgi:hypothetical protein